MAAGSTYTPIATNTLSSDTATVTFSSISASYTDLVLIINGGTASTGNFYVRFNSDTGSNYSYTALYGTGSAAGSTRESSKTLLYINYYGYGENNLNANTIVNIMNYSNTTTNKTLVARANNTGNGVNANVGLWRSTAAISTILIGADFGGAVNMKSGTTFTLYGIAAA